MLEHIFLSFLALLLGVAAYVIYYLHKIKLSLIQSREYEAKENQKNIDQFRLQVQTLNTSHSQKILDLESKRRLEMLCFGNCQCFDLNCHQGWCSRPIRYLISNTRKTKSLVCGVCFLRLKELNAVELSEDLEPLKPPSFRRTAYKNEVDKNR
jgi:cell division protein FtsL